jgi:hypothetical protein
MLTLGYFLGINYKTMRYTHRYTEFSNYDIVNILVKASLPCPVQC